LSKINTLQKFGKVHNLYGADCLKAENDAKMTTAGKYLQKVITKFQNTYNRKGSKKQPSCHSPGLERSRSVVPGMPEHS